MATTVRREMIKTNTLKSYTVFSIQLRRVFHAINQEG
jgi:hypothetical protein